jgi:hypothetical protein
MLSCDDFTAAGGTFEAKEDASTQSWTAKLKIPLASADVEVLRSNLFRVLMKNNVTVCDPANCEYGAWAPTNTPEPQYHVTTALGVLVLPPKPSAPVPAPAPAPTPMPRPAPPTPTPPPSTGNGTSAPAPSVNPTVDGAGLGPGFIALIVVGACAAIALVGIVVVRVVRGGAGGLSNNLSYSSLDT